MTLIIATHPHSESSRTNTLSGAGIDFPVDNLDTNLTTSNGYYAMPRPEYLIRLMAFFVSIKALTIHVNMYLCHAEKLPTFRTVIKNGTDLLRRTVNLQAFKHDMEERLTRTYRF